MDSVRKIISGGQTGVDQAALQAAIDAGLEHGGWCPPERVCEAGSIPIHFDLKETPVERDPAATDIPRSQRTIWNVRDSDASLIFMVNKEAGKRTDKGTGLGLETAILLDKPHLIASPDSTDAAKIRLWMRGKDIEVLSVGGPSEKTCPGIYEKVYRILTKVFTDP